ncbi:MAG: hypothetical protein LKJ69_02985 [Lactobacillus sp.]|jgi:aldose 1-epimerase|nr:hypothetical protein [Lactobacillus sp.]
MSMPKFTDAQAVILYSGNHFAHNGVAPAIPQYGGITMEAQTAPETSADWSDITLLPLTPRTRHITWQFEY